MGKAIWNPLSGRPCMRGRPESLWYFDLNGQVKIHEDWVIRRKPRGIKTKLSEGSSETIRVGTVMSKI